MAALERRVRPGAGLVQVRLERASELSEGLAAALTLGASSLVVGVLVYLLLPYALLHEWQSVLMMVFLAFLLGLFVGLAVLLCWLEALLERVLARALLAGWEAGVVWRLVHSNLLAHGRRNRRTALMYAIGVGLVVFLLALLRSQYASFLLNAQQSAGSPLRVRVDWNEADEEVPVARLEAFLEPYRAPAAGLVEAAAWQTQSLSRVLDRLTSPGNYTRIAILGHVLSDSSRVYAVSPGFFETQFPGLLSVHRGPPLPDDSSDDEAVGGALLEELYSAHGSAEMLLGAAYMERFALQVGSPLVLETAGRRLLLRAAAFLSSCPTFRFSLRLSSHHQDALVSLPTFLRLAQPALPSIDSIPVASLHMRLRSDAGTVPIRCFKRALTRELGGCI